MTLSDLRSKLLTIPDADVKPEKGVQTVVEFLASDAALELLAADPYWPKWNGPWWQMLLLFELGEAHRIPQRAVQATVDALNALPLHIFPLRPDEWPANFDPSRHASCHCAIGSIDQVLAASGVDVEAALPWIRPWYDRYQMRDGGLNCDESAYLVENECASSMVGTIACFEAMLRRGPSEFTERGAAFLMGRGLLRGSDTYHNADERAAEASWLAPTFPRFYFYDVLRGLTALVRWASAFRRALPLQAVSAAATHLVALAPDGVMRVGRQAHAGKATWGQDAHGVWTRVSLAGTFPLLDAVSVVGAPSATLTAEWRETRHALVALIDAGLVTQ